MKVDQISPQTMRRLKQLWLVVVTVFVTVVVLRHHNHLDIYLSRLDWLQIGISFFFIVLGKLLMSGVAHRAIKCSIPSVTFGFSFYAYHVTQLPKYIPGSVWQHISRVYIYGDHGISRLRALNIIIYENFWLVITSASLGSSIIFLGYSGIHLHGIWTALESADPAMIIIFLLLAISAVAIAMLNRNNIRSATILKNIMRPDFIMTGLLLLVWIALGLSMYILLPQREFSFDSLVYTKSVFALGYGIGFMVPIAPAGLGIRESVLIAGFLHLAPTLELGVIIAVHRLLYLAADLLFTAIASVCSPEPRPLSQPSV